MTKTITTAEELATQPEGTIVRSSAGTIACRFDQKRGVVFGSDYPFPWDSLQLPLTVLYRPDQPTEPARVLPSREEIRALFHSTHSDTCTGWCETQTERALALFAAQPTVEQVKAEALREHRRRVVRFMPAGLVNRATVLADLDDYADRLAGGDSDA